MERWFGKNVDLLVEHLKVFPLYLPEGLRKTMRNLLQDIWSMDRHINPNPNFTILIQGTRWSYTCNRPWRPVGLWDIEDPIFCIQSAHGRRWGCQPYAPGAPLPVERFLVLISLRDWVDPRVIMLLEGLGQFKNPMTSWGIERATFRLVA
jgi:hypothetical protein